MAGRGGIETSDAVKSVKHISKLVRKLLFPLRPFFSNELLEETTIFVLCFIFETNRLIDQPNYSDLRSRSDDYLGISGQKFLGLYKFAAATSVNERIADIYQHGAFVAVNHQAPWTAILSPKVLRRSDIAPDIITYL